MLPTIERASVDLLLSDPPYNTTNLIWDKAVDWKRFWTEAARVCRPTTPIVLFASGKFTIKLINTKPAWFRYELIWEKTMAVGFLDANRRPLRAHENILVFAERLKGSTYNPQMVVGRVHARGSEGGRARHYGTHRRGIPSRSNLFYPRSVLRFSNVNAGGSKHPTQKPLDLVEWLVLTYSKPGALVLDPFAGSGTTLVAAKRTGRRGIGIEMDEDYCRIARERLALQA